MKNLPLWQIGVVALLAIAVNVGVFIGCVWLVVKLLQMMGVL